MFGMHMQGNISQAAPAQQLPLQQQQQLPQLGGVLGGLLGMGQAQQQDTLDGLLGQVNQELMREAGARQYAALQFGTLDTLGTPTASAAAAAAAVAGMGFGPACMGMPGGMQQQQQHWQQQGVLPGGAAAAGFGGGPVAVAGAGWMGGLPGQFGAPGMAQPQQQQAQQQQQVALQGMQAGAADESSQEVVRCAPPLLLVRSVGWHSDGGTDVVAQGSRVANALQAVTSAPSTLQSIPNFA
jgi:hypothetical protein